MSQDRFYPIGMDHEHYICYRTSANLTIDGKADEADWQAAEWTNDFVDIEGHLKPLPSLRTRAKMLWDDSYMYFYAYMEEPHVWGTLTERDAVIFYDDDFEIFIDPDGDGINYYEFEVNILETLWELLLARAYRADNRPKVLDNWNLRDIQVAVHVDGTVNDPSDIDQGWGVEWAIPFAALEELADFEKRPKDGDHWRVDFSRVDWDMDIVSGNYKKKLDSNTGKSLPEHNWVWSPTGKINMHIPEMWGVVQFSNHKVGEKGAQFRPDPDKKFKDQLWKMYQLQLERSNNQQSYISNRKEMCKALGGDALSKSFKMHTTPNYFEIILETNTPGKKWAINSQGRLYLSAS